MTLPPHWQEPAPLDLRKITATGFSLVDEILQRRGFEDNGLVEAWLNVDLEQMAEKTEVPGLIEVVDRIARAIAEGHGILIFGDYDCDGITSTAILFSALSHAARNHRDIRWMLPSRDAGYGLRESQISRVLDLSPNLLILIDCGSNDVDSIAALRSHGIDVVVIDHHQISAQLPTDVRLANPQLAPGNSSTVLTAAGLAWLAVRMLENQGVRVCPDGEGNRRYLDLAAIGTIADVAPLTGINRPLVRDGISQLRNARRHGLRALAREAKFDLQQIRAEDIPFKISSVLNSPGRLGEPDVVLDLLLASNFDRSSEGARSVMALSKRRKALSEKVMSDALAAAELLKDDPILIVTGDHWHSGVLGPVATKLVERYGRPAIVLGGSDDRLTGSGRSVPGWDIAAAFRANSEFILHSGGHGGAAGLTVAREQLDNFKFAVNAYAEAVPYKAAVATLEIDAEVTMQGLPFGLVDKIETLAPFGRGNPRPLLLWRGANLMYLKKVGKSGETVQMEIGDASYSVRGVLFKDAARLGEPRSDQQFDLIVEPSISTWNGRSRVEVRLVDFQLSD